MGEPPPGAPLRPAPCAAAAGAPPGAPAATPSAPGQWAWRADWEAAKPALDALTARLPPRAGSAGSAAAPRSAQADAARLDDELAAMLREQLLRALAPLRLALAARLAPELGLALEALILRFSVFAGRPLPGMALMNLRHLDARGAAAAADPGGASGAEGPGLSPAQRWAYCLAGAGARWAWARGGRAAAAGGGGGAAAAAAVAMRAAESVHRAAALLNHLDFLLSGRYRSLLERLVGARLVAARPDAPRAVSYEYLNRQLVWAELSELLLSLLPLVDAAAVQRALRAALPRPPAVGEARAVAGGAAADAAADASAAPPLGCGFCGAREVLLPYAAEPCGHAFCYYCLRAAALDDPGGLACPRCAARVEGMRPRPARAPLDEKGQG
jgi:peroxin-2